MNNETKALIDGLETLDHRHLIRESDTEWVDKSDVIDLMEKLTKQIEIKTSHKLEWERKYWEAYDLLIEHKIIESPIKQSAKFA